jgi:aryl-alcohol dehydrogenase-like predicted oxidoreductase
MQYRELGSSGIEVSAVGFGCWQIGGYYWGEVDENEWIAAVHRALDMGVTWFDTADFYGFGRSEEVLSKALGTRRQDVVIASKVGLVSRGGRVNFRADELIALEHHIRKDLSRRHILEAAEASLRRLRTDVIDLYLLHWPDPATPLEETMGALEELIASGKIRVAGCCNFSLQQMREARRYLSLQAHQLPYSMLNRSAEDELLPGCRADGVGVITYWALSKGLLTGTLTPASAFSATDWRHYDPLFQGEEFQRNLQLVERLKSVAIDEGVSLPQLAIAWVLSQPGVTSAIVGAKTASQAAENAGGGSVSLAGSTMARIADIFKGLERPL